MKAGELIEALKKFNPDMEVLFPYEEMGYADTIAVVGNHLYLDPEDDSPSAVLIIIGQVNDDIVS